MHAYYRRKYVCMLPVIAATEHEGVKKERKAERVGNNENVRDETTARQDRSVRRYMQS